MPRGFKRTHDQFVDELKKAQPKLKVIGEYINCNKKVLVKDEFGICDSFPISLLAGHRTSINSAIDKDSYFINKANSTHNNRYDYSKVDYVHSQTKVRITCLIHGEFTQTPCNHLRGRGCPDCARTDIAAKITDDNSRFEAKAIKTHGLKYNYSKVDYNGTKIKVTIICLIHGEFTQMPSNHLSGTGCQKCANERVSANSRLSNTEFIEKANIEHDFKYTYSKSIYSLSINEVIITCPIHGDFKQVAGDHLRGHGCPDCKFESTGWGRSAFKKSAKGNMCLLYKIHCWNDTESFYKIGRTVQEINKRFSGHHMPYNYRVVSELYGDSDYIFDLENKEKRKHRKLEYMPNISFGGSKRECFSKLI